MVYGRCSGGVQEVCHPHNGFFYISIIRTEEDKKKKKVGYRSRRITVFGDLIILLTNYYIVITMYYAIEPTKLTLSYCARHDVVPSFNS